MDFQPSATPRLAVKGCNYTLGPNGIVPTLLLFGAFTDRLAAQSKMPRQQEGMRALSEV